MPRRRQQGLATVLMGCHWSVAAGFAVATYIGLKFILPGVVTPHNPLIFPLAKALSQNAGYLSLIFGFIALFAWINQMQKRRLLDNQKDINSIRNMTWQQFELLTGEMFRRNGFKVEENGGGGPDGGIDLFIYKDGKKHVVQCKRWKSTQVSVSPVRELFGVMTAERTDGAVFVTSGKYTQDARDFAENKPIWLIDGEELAKMVKGVQQTRAVESLSAQVKSVAPIPDQSAQPAVAGFSVASSPECPRCGQPMVKRQSKKSVHAGSEFWGCSSYPKCRGIRQVE